MDKNEAPASAVDIMSEATEAAAGLLPLDMVNAIADLADPAAVAKEMPWLAGEMVKIALGQSDISSDERDKRFADEAWRSVPYFRLLGQSYRLFELWMERMYQGVDGSWQNKARARVAADLIAAALAPTNYLGANPGALREAAGPGGLPQCSGVSAEVVGRSQRSRDEVRRDAGARLILPGAVHALVHPLHPQLEQPVGLAQQAEVGDAPPRLIREALVSLVERDIRLAERDLHHLSGQPRHFLRDSGGIGEVSDGVDHIQRQQAGRCFSRL